MTFIKKCWQLRMLTWLFLGAGNGLQIAAGVGLTTEPYNKDLMKNETSPPVNIYIEQIVSLPAPCFSCVTYLYSSVPLHPSAIYRDYGCSKLSGCADMGMNEKTKQTE